MKRIIEDGCQRPLEEFAQCAVIYLMRHPEYVEVVQLAKNIVELANDASIPPGQVYELPEGYEYNVGEAISVVRKA